MIAPKLDKVKKQRSTPEKQQVVNIEKKHDFQSAFGKPPSCEMFVDNPW